MRYSSRFFLYAPFAILVALFGIAMLRWWSLAADWDSRLRRMNGHEIAPGIALRFESVAIGGFPFGLDLAFQGLRITVAAPRGPLVWYSPRLLSYSLTYGRDQKVFEASGGQDLSWSDPQGVRHDLRFDAASFRASALWRSQCLDRFDVDLLSPRSPAISGARVQLHARQAAMQNAIELSISADDIESTPGRPIGLGRMLRTFVFQGKLVPAAALRSLLCGTENWQDAAEAWRSKSGSLSVGKVAAQFDDLAVAGHGALVLDGRRRPAGALDVVVSELAPGQRAAPVFYGRLAGALAALTNAASAEGRPVSANLQLQNGLTLLAPTRNDGGSSKKPGDFAGQIDPLY
ncbi:MAG TPA: DUF2125 domain-containing protein [Rhizomicrobium sp.]|jgi:hypothetical protein